MWSWGGAIFGLRAIICINFLEVHSMLHTKNQSISFVVFDKIFNVFTLIPLPSIWFRYARTGTIWTIIEEGNIPKDQFYQVLSNQVSRLDGINCWWCLTDFNDDNSTAWAYGSGELKMARKIQLNMYIW